jgi:isopenicillin N synthase-like dioxygenase
MQPQTSPATRLLAPATMIGGEIPLIDVSGFLASKPGAAERAAVELRFAFENVGFYYLAGHGVSQALIDTAYAEAARFHALPLETKLAVKVDEHNIGYMPIARKPPPNAAAQGKKPSQNEAYFLRREKTPDHPDVTSNRRFHAMNKWPDETAIPGFRANMLAYTGTMEALCRKLVRLYALALDLPDTFFDACFAEPHVIQRMSRYPAIDGADSSINSLVAHTDSGFMTLLPPNKVLGLEITCPTAAGSRRRACRTPSSSTAATCCTAGPTNASCRRRTACATFRGNCVTPCRSSAIPTTTPSSNACRRASRLSTLRSIRRSRWATTRCGSPPSATNTWPRSRPRARPTSRRARAPPPAGRADFRFMFLCPARGRG